MQIFHQFHDGFVDGVWTEGYRVHINLRTVDNERFAAIIDGVEALNVSGFRTGNIILDVSVFDHGEVTAEHIEELYDLPLEGEAKSKMRSMLLEKVKAEKLIVLRISPSYGATCAALGRAVNLMEEAPTRPPRASE